MRKRALATVLSVFMAAASLAGCGKTGEEAAQNQSQAQPEAERGTEAAKSGETGFQTTYGDKVFDNVTLTVEVFDRSNAPEGSTVIDNKWVDYINEQMGKVGINVEFVAVPRSEEVSKVQTMMSSGTGADIMLCYTTSVVEGFYNDGGTYDLAPYIDGEGQAENLKKYIGEECMNIARNADGALWAVAARRASTAQDEIFIRKDWLDALNMEIPTTIDEMYDYLVQCKNNNPDGQTDVLASSFLDCKQLVGPMALSFCESVLDEKQWNIYGSNVATLVYGDDGMVEYYRWMNKLYNEGLIDPEYYTHNDFAQTTKENIVSGKLASFELDANYQIDASRGSLLVNLQQNNPNADIISIAPMQNANDGQVYNAGYTMNGAYVFVPKTCANPEAAVTYLDWLATEKGGFVIYNGFEGEHYTMEDDIPITIDADYNSSDRDWIRNDLFLVGNAGYFFTDEAFAKATASTYPGYEDYVLKNYENATTGIVRYTPTFSGSKWTEYSTDVGLVIDEYVVKCITCAPEEFDANMESFRQELKANGMDEVIAERQEYYDALFQ